MPKYLLESWKSLFYLEPLIPILQIFVLVVFLKHKRINEEFNTITFIFISTSIIQFTIVPIFCSLNLNHFLKVVDPIQTAAYQIVEFTFFMIFLTTTQNSKIVKFVFRLSSIPFLFFTVVVITSAIMKTNSYFSPIQGVTLSACFIYIPSVFGALNFFLEFMKINDPTLPAEKPSFWITTGILIYSIYSLPFSLIERNIALSNSRIFYLLYTGHYIVYIFFYLTLLKALRCKKPLTT